VRKLGHRSRFGGASFDLSRMFTRVRQFLVHMLDGLREEVETLLDALGGDIEVPARFLVRDRVLAAS